MKSAVTKCHAKINLSLDVVGKREDGYHDVELILNEISLCDTLKVTLIEGGIKLMCDDETLPSDSGNIAYRAAEMFFEEAGLNLGADLELNKKIPHGAGLAGGSADAAGVLRLLNELTGYPLSKEKVLAVAKRLGADVPFCVKGGCALAEGIGDILTPLPAPKGFTYVIAKPKESISTAFVYNNLNLENRPENLNVKNVAEAIRVGDTEMLVKNAGNIMESVTAEAVPIIKDIKSELNKSGAILSLMSGSGTAVFGMFKSRETAENAANEVRCLTDEVYVV